MTTLPNKPKTTQPTPSDAVRERIKAGMLMAFPAGMDEASIDRAVDKILSALSDAGLAVLDPEPFESLISAARGMPNWRDDLCEAILRHAIERAEEALPTGEDR